jgi:hypothetical protein
MEPKFQSSFIPKGPTASNVSSSGAPIRKTKSILGLIAMVAFSLSVLGALGVLGYKFYLNYSIKAMAVELEAGKASIEEETVKEIMRLNNRILATGELIDQHLILTPLFNFLEASTLRSVRFSEFRYSAEGEQLKLMMKGEARGYSALALQAELFKRSKNFINPVFSDLSLDERGNVTFSITTGVDQSFLSYGREVERLNAASQPIIAPVTTTPASTTPVTATTTPRN